MNLPHISSSIRSREVNDTLSIVEITYGHTHSLTESVYTFWSRWILFRCCAVIGVSLTRLLMVTVLPDECNIGKSTVRNGFRTYYHAQLAHDEYVDFLPSFISEHFITVSCLPVLPAVRNSFSESPLKVLQKMLSTNYQNLWNFCYNSREALVSFSGSRFFLFHYCRKKFLNSFY